VAVTLEVVPGVPHVFQAYAAVLDEGGAALDRAAAFLQAHFADRSAIAPEYNRSTAGVLKNAIDYLHTEWNNKAMGVMPSEPSAGAESGPNTFS